MYLQLLVRLPSDTFNSPNASHATRPPLARLAFAGANISVAQVCLAYSGGLDTSCICMRPCCPS
jgi:hypothetical protein